MKKLSGAKIQEIANLAKNLKAQRQKTRELGKLPLFPGKAKQVEGSRMLEKRLGQAFQWQGRDKRGRLANQFEDPGVTWRQNRDNLMDVLSDFSRVPPNHPLGPPRMLDLSAERESFKPGGRNFWQKPKKDPEEGQVLSERVLKENRALEKNMPGSFTKSFPPELHGWLLRGEGKPAKVVNRPYRTKPISAARKRIVYRDPESGRLYRSQRGDFPHPEANIVEREVGRRGDRYIQRRLIDNRPIIGEDIDRLTRKKFSRYVRENLERPGRKLERVPTYLDDKPNPASPHPVYRGEMDVAEYLHLINSKNNPTYFPRPDRAGRRKKGKPLLEDFTPIVGDPEFDIRSYLRASHRDINKGVTPRYKETKKESLEKYLKEIFPPGADLSEFLQGPTKKALGRIPMRDLFSTKPLPDEIVVRGMPSIKETAFRKMKLLDPDFAFRKKMFDEKGGKMFREHVKNKKSVKELLSQAKTLSDKDKRLINKSKGEGR